MPCRAQMSKDFHYAAEISQNVPIIHILTVWSSKILTNTTGWPKTPPMPQSSVSFISTKNLTCNNHTSDRPCPPITDCIQTDATPTRCIRRPGPAAGAPHPLGSQSN
ncbi:hypothetical protein AMECASPLE_013106 [Ameca splendens]|uniref:Uncharacterized protein n=1 Tax=Ameca splendens TaxID=208324 RepID=A0ABV0Z0D2_9TELE